MRKPALDNLLCFVGYDVHNGRVVERWRPGVAVVAELGVPRNKVRVEVVEVEGQGMLSIIVHPGAVKRVPVPAVHFLPGLWTTAKELAPLRQL